LPLAEALGRCNPDQRAPSPALAKEDVLYATRPKPPAQLIRATRSRRASKKPVAEGGWNVFGTDFEGAEMLNPWLNPPLPANGDKAWFGWPNEAKIEALRKEWLQAGDSEARQEIAAKIQERAFETVPYIPTGQYSPKTAYRKNLRGIIIAPALFMWNLEKT
jgi:peptide/nickel transport system substrate-binding protein